MCPVNNTWPPWRDEAGRGVARRCVAYCGFEMRLAAETHSPPYHSHESVSSRVARNTSREESVICVIWRLGRGTPGRPEREKGQGKKGTGTGWGLWASAAGPLPLRLCLCASASGPLPLGLCLWASASGPLPLGPVPLAARPSGPH